MLRLPGACVIDVCFGAEGVIVCVGLRHRRRVCSGCGQTGGQLQIHDRRVKRWRHLDLGANRCVIECELRRLRCPDCGVHLEARLAVLGLHDADIHGEEAYTWLTSADTSGWLDGARPVDVIAESSTFVLAAVEDEVLHVLADKPARQRTYHLPLQPARPVRARRGDSHRADAGGKPKRATTTKRRAAKRRVAPKDCD
jgi:hypothetical protein